MAEMIDGVAGAVLAGGEGRRFGGGKAVAPWGGSTMTGGVAAILARIFRYNMILVKNAEPFRGLDDGHVRVVLDIVADSHPLGGILTALRRAPTPRVFVCACDMPFLKPALIERLCAEPARFDAVVPVWEGRPQPLCAVYSRNCAGAVERLIQDGRPRVMDLLGLVSTRYFAEEDIRPLDPAGASFVDLDTRQAYLRARAQAPC